MTHIILYQSFCLFHTYTVRSLLIIDLSYSTYIVYINRKIIVWSATECLTTIALTQINLLRLDLAVYLLLHLALLHHLERSIAQIFYFPRLQHLLILLFLLALLFPPVFHLQQSLLDTSEAIITSLLLLLVRVSLYGLQSFYSLLELFYFLEEAVLTDFPKTVLVGEFRGIVLQVSLTGEGVLSLGEELEGVVV